MRANEGLIIIIFCLLFSIYPLSVLPVNVKASLVDRWRDPSYLRVNAFDLHSNRIIAACQIAVELWNSIGSRVRLVYTNSPYADIYLHEVYLRNEPPGWTPPPQRDEEGYLVRVDVYINTYYVSRGNVSYYNDTTLFRYAIAVCAHELGHALGLGHVSISAAIMGTKDGFVRNHDVFTPLYDDIMSIRDGYDNVYTSASSPVIGTSTYYGRVSSWGYYPNGYPYNVYVTQSGGGHYAFAYTYHWYFVEDTGVTHLSRMVIARVKGYTLRFSGMGGYVVSDPSRWDKRLFTAEVDNDYAKLVYTIDASPNLRVMRLTSKASPYRPVTIDPYETYWVQVIGFYDWDAHYFHKRPIFKAAAYIYKYGETWNLLGYAISDEEENHKGMYSGTSYIHADWWLSYLIYLGFGVWTDSWLDPKSDYIFYGFWAERHEITSQYQAYGTVKL